MSNIYIGINHNKDNLINFCKLNSPSVIFHSYSMIDKDVIYKIQQKLIKKVSTSHMPINWHDMHSFMSDPNIIFNLEYAKYYNWLIFYNCKLDTTNKIEFIINKYKEKNILFLPNLEDDKIFAIWDSYLNSNYMKIYDLNKTNNNLFNKRLLFKSLLNR